VTPAGEDAAANQWFTRTESTSRATPRWALAHVDRGDDDDLALELVAPRRHGSRVAVACLGLIGVAAALVVSTFVTYSARSDRHDGTETPSVAPSEAAPASLAVRPVPSGVAASPAPAMKAVDPETPVEAATSLPPAPAPEAVHEAAKDAVEGAAH